MPRALLAMLTMAAVGCGSSTPNPNVVIETSMGTIKAELYQDRAPGTVRNFLLYVDDKHYDNTIFHRVIPDFMIQGGGFEPGALAKNDEKETRGGIKNESDNGLTNKRGTLAMARTNNPHSATAQFFINVKDNNFLDRAEAKDRYGYCVFGEVVEGMEVLDKIASLEVGDYGGVFNMFPKQTVAIQSAERVR